MMRKKLISIRLDEELLQKIDNFVSKHTYATRSCVISNVLENVVNCSTTGTLIDLAFTSFAFEKGFVCRFKKDAETLKLRAKS